MAKERIESDYYPSPIWTIDALLSHIDIALDDVCLEPALGDGRIFDRFPTGNECKWAEISAHRDYLNTDRDFKADVIITNPPFSLALEFIRTALTRDLKESGTCCMLLRVGILGSKERSDFWREFPFTSLAVMSPRPAFVHGRTDNSEYAWFIWDYGNRFDLPALWTFKREEHDEDYAKMLADKAMAKRKKKIVEDVKQKTGFTGKKLKAEVEKILLSMEK